MDQERKLATIVAIDVAGYSARAEEDEARAVAEVAELRRRVSEAASLHGGRLFNTAGDGFMLEFPTVTGALAAAEAIAAGPEPAVRVGVHLGEVSVTPTGDLLGHGVNVAARLQAQAPPGGVLVSADVHRAVRGPLAARLRPQGRLRLDKMRETVEAFVLAGPVLSKTPKPWRWELPAATGVVVAALVALAGFAYSRLSAPPADRIAVLAPEALGGGAAAQRFAGGLADQVLGTMTAAQIPTAAPGDAEALRKDAPAAARRLGVRWLLAGAVQDEAGTLHANLRLDDPTRRRTLWSGAYEGPAAEAEALQRQIAVKVAAVLKCADDLGRRPGAPDDSASQGLFLRGCDEAAGIFDADPQRSERALDAARQLTRSAPGFARGHAKLASALGAAYRHSDGTGKPDEGLAAARRALQLDPGDGEAYLALSLLQPARAYQAREELLARGLAKSPDEPGLLFRTAQLMADVGRMKEAADYANRAAARAPLEAPIVAAAILYSAQAGLDREARAQAGRVARQWPASPPLWGARFWSATWGGRLAEAEKLLDDAPGLIGSDQLDQWRRCLGAVQAGRPAMVGAVAAGVMAFGRLNALNQRQAVQCLGLLGRVDDAFELAKDFAPEQYWYEGTAIFFSPSTRAMRADRRFMGFAARIGLADYWRKTGRWPDFCAAPGLAYDCRAEAARAVGGVT